MRTISVRLATPAAVLLLALSAPAFDCGGGGAGGPGSGSGGDSQTGQGGDTSTGGGGTSATGQGGGTTTATGGKTGSGGATTTGTGGATGAGGVNASGCAGTLVKCSGACVDTSGSQTNCGACGVTCRSDQTCWMGGCKCATGSADCSGVCKDVTSSTANCGTCGNVCATGATCVTGTCACPTDQMACSGACRAVLSDAQNCGKCGTICTGSTMCLFGACVDPSSLACSPATQANKSSTKDASISLGKYWVNNNWWGASSGSGSNTIWSMCQQGDLIAWGTSWSWTGTANQVKSYASTVLGWQWGWKVTNSGLPLQIQSGKNLNCGWDFTVTQSGGAIDVSFDTFAHTQMMPGTNDDPSDEIMIWLYRGGGAGPVGTRQTSVTIGSVPYDLYRGTTRWNVFSYVRQTSATTAVVNVMDFMRDLMTRGWLQGTKYLTSVQSGTEIFVGTGELDTKGYYCRVQ